MTNRSCKWTLDSRFEGFSDLGRVASGPVSGVLSALRFVTNEAARLGCGLVKESS